MDFVKNIAFNFLGKSNKGSDFFKILSFSANTAVILWLWSQG
jgi:hypothetical protein